MAEKPARHDAGGAASPSGRCNAPTPSRGRTVPESCSGSGAATTRRSICTDSPLQGTARTSVPSGAPRPRAPRRPFPSRRCAAGSLRARNVPGPPRCGGLGSSSEKSLGHGWIGLQINSLGHAVRAGPCGRSGSTACPPSSPATGVRPGLGGPTQPESGSAPTAAHLPGPWPDREDPRLASISRGRRRRRVSPRLDARAVGRARGPAPDVPSRPSALKPGRSPFARASAPPLGSPAPVPVPGPATAATSGARWRHAGGAPPPP
jgi:hypothetical protein